MTLPVIRIPEALVGRVMDAAEEAYPQECCGLLVGRAETSGDFIVTEAVPSPNVADGDHAERFEVDPQLRFNLMRRLGDGPVGIIGHYHSHPGHAGEPSPTDLEMAFEPDMVWLIIAVEKGLAQRPRAHIVDTQGGRFREIEVHFFPQPAP